MIRVSQFRAQYRVSEIQNSHYRVSEITPYRALLFQNGKIDMIDLAIFARAETITRVLENRLVPSLLE